MERSIGFRSISDLLLIVTMIQGIAPDSVDLASMRAFQVVSLYLYDSDGLPDLDDSLKVVCESTGFENTLARFRVRELEWVPVLDSIAYHVVKPKELLIRMRYRHRGTVASPDIVTSLCQLIC